MEHMLQMSQHSIFHNISKYVVFQRRKKVLLWSKGLSRCSLNFEHYLPKDSCFKRHMDSLILIEDVLKFGTLLPAKRPRQTEQTQIRLLP